MFNKLFGIKNIITKRIPIKFILNEGLSYQRAIKHFSKTQFQELENNRLTGFKKFTIQFTKKIGTTG